MDVKVTYHCQQFIKDNGAREQNPRTYPHCELSLQEDGEADLFFEGRLLVKFTTLKIRISANGIYMKGLERIGSKLFYREFWLRYALPAVSDAPPSEN